jgi:hypothetical protein
MRPEVLARPRKPAMRSHTNVLVLAPTEQAAAAPQTQPLVGTCPPMDKVWSAYDLGGGNRHGPAGIVGRCGASGSGGLTGLAVLFFLVGTGGAR